MFRIARHLPSAAPCAADDSLYFPDMSFFGMQNICFAIVQDLFTVASPWSTEGRPRLDINTLCKLFGGDMRVAAAWQTGIIAGGFVKALAAGKHSTRALGDLKIPNHKSTTPRVVSQNKMVCQESIVLYKSL